jgi:hypothetical protein
MFLFSLLICSVNDCDVPLSLKEFHDDNFYLAEACLHLLLMMKFVDCDYPVSLQLETDYSAPPLGKTVAVARPMRHCSTHPSYFLHPNTGCSFLKHFGRKTLK